MIVLIIIASILKINTLRVWEFKYFALGCTTNMLQSHNLHLDHFDYKKAFSFDYFISYIYHFSFSSVAQSCPTLRDPMNRSRPGLPVRHQLPESTQTHVYQVGDPSNHLILCRPLLLLPPIPPSIGVFSDESALRIRVAKVLEFQLQHQSFQWAPRTDFLQDGLVGSPCSPRDSQESFPTPQFKSINSLALSFLYSLTLTYIHDHWKNHILD